MKVPPYEFCPIFGDRSECGVPNLAQMLNEMLLNAAKYQAYSFYRFCVINGKPTGSENTPLRIQIMKI